MHLKEHNKITAMSVLDSYLSYFQVLFFKETSFADRYSTLMKWNSYNFHERTANVNFCSCILYTKSYQTAVRRVQNSNLH